MANKMCDTSAIFKNAAQSKQSPVGRKFAQSGHPGHDHEENLNLISCLFKATWQFTQTSG
jgi:hypothetical protein